MNALGYHYLIELYECNAKKLADEPFLQQILQEAVTRSESHTIGQIFHGFTPHGVSGVMLIAESHFSIHTWPEYDYAAIDFFTCDPKAQISMAYTFLAAELESKRHSISEIKRGIDINR